MALHLTLKEIYFEERIHGQQYDLLRESIEPARNWLRQLACQLAGLTGNKPSEWRDHLQSLSLVRPDARKALLKQALGAAKLIVLLGALLQDETTHAGDIEELISGSEIWSTRISRILALVEKRWGKVFRKDSFDFKRDSGLSEEIVRIASNIASGLRKKLNKNEATVETHLKTGAAGPPETEGATTSNPARSTIMDEEVLDEVAEPQPAPMEAPMEAPRQTREAEKRSSKRSSGRRRVHAVSQKRPKATSATLATSTFVNLLGAAGALANLPKVLRPSMHNAPMTYFKITVNYLQLILRNLKTNSAGCG